MHSIEGLQTPDSETLESDGGISDRKREKSKELPCVWKTLGLYQYSVI
jgi:hypothetical protein